MKKSVVIVSVLVGLLLIFGFFAYNYVYHSQHRNVGAETATVTIKATSIAQQFQSDLPSANANYLDKVVVVSGSVTAIDGSNIILDATVNCVMNSPIQPKIGQQLSIKGRVVGYDDFLGELKLDQCIIIQ